MTNTTRKLCGLFLGLLLVLLPLALLVSNANYQDGFENYPAGVVNSVSELSYGNNLGWVFDNVTGSCFKGFIWNLGAPDIYAGSQSFFFDDTGSCSSGNYATLKLGLIATSNVVTAAVYYNMSGAEVSIHAGANGNFGRVNDTWTNLNISSGAVVGSYISIYLECYSEGTAPGCAFDQVNVTGANLYNHPTNFQMVSWLTRPAQYNLMGIGGYDSSVTINYTNALPKTVHNVTAAGLNLPYSHTNTTLITVQVGNGYSRTLLPQYNTVTSSWNTTMYLDAPDQVNNYLLNFINVAGYTKAGNVIVVSLGGYNITTGYLDAGLGFPCWLTPNTYNIQLRNGTSPTTQVIFNANLNVAPTTSGQTVLSMSVTNFTVPVLTTPLADILVGLSRPTTTSVQVTYNDTTGDTIGVIAQIFLANITGTYAVSTPLCVNLTAYGSCPSVTPIGFANLGDFIGLQSNLTSGMYVTILINSSTYGTNFALASYPLVSGDLLPYVGPTGNDNCIAGLCALLTPSFNSTNDAIFDILSFIILIGFAVSVPREFAAGLGTLCVVVLAALFYASNWISLSVSSAIAPVGMMALFAVFAILDLFHVGEKKSANVYGD